MILLGHLELGSTINAGSVQCRQNYPNKKHLLLDVHELVLRFEQVCRQASKFSLCSNVSPTSHPSRKEKLHNLNRLWLFCFHGIGHWTSLYIYRKLTVSAWLPQQRALTVAYYQASAQVGSMKLTWWIVSLPLARPSYVARNWKSNTTPTSSTYFFMKHKSVHLFGLSCCHHI